MINITDLVEVTLNENDDFKKRINDQTIPYESETITNPGPDTVNNQYII